MAIHHLNDKSDAIRQILEEWHDQKKELETLRDYLKTHSAQPKETMKPTDCLRGLKFQPKDQHYFCGRCKREHFDKYQACQELKGENR